MALALEDSTMTLLHRTVLAFFVAYMAYTEGYKGFHHGFAPRLVIRAIYLKNNPRILHVLLAPLFCMGYIYATRKRQIISIGLTLMIICFILIAHILPQPWRGIIDAGVVVGLSIGVISITYFIFLAILNPQAIEMPAELPDDA